jgi:hypothetical protein
MRGPRARSNREQRGYFLHTPYHYGLARGHHFGRALRLGSAGRHLPLMGDHRATIRDCSARSKDWPYFARTAPDVLDDESCSSSYSPSKGRARSGARPTCASAGERTFKKSPASAKCRDEGSASAAPGVPTQPADPSAERPVFHWRTPPRIRLADWPTGHGQSTLGGSKSRHLSRGASTQSQ